MAKFLLDKLLEEAQNSISAEEVEARKAKNKKKAERQACRPQGRGRKKGK
jgi:hypothetical protein